MAELISFAAPKFVDNRGWFTEIYNAHREKQNGINDIFIQDNQSFSEKAGTIRGIHFQLPPMAQAKLVRCTRGAIIDYAIDLRRGSPTYSEYVSIDLSAENSRQLYIPVGFGHAFVTLEDATEISYKVSAPYSAEHDAGVRWNCQLIGIRWPVDNERAILSEKDTALPTLEDFESPFDYDGPPMKLVTAN